jgi:hypothetical protein
MNLHLYPGAEPREREFNRDATPWLSLQSFLELGCQNPRFPIRVIKTTSISCPLTFASTSVASTVGKTFGSFSSIFTTMGYPLYVPLSN